MHYYQHNIADYRKDTSHLSLLEHGIYRQLIDTYHLDELPLCGDYAKLMRSHSIRTNEEIQALENVLNDFFMLTENGYTHKCCDKVIEKYHLKSQKASDSAKVRWDKPTKSCELHANALRSICDDNAIGMLTINHKPITNIKTLSSKPEFDDAVGLSVKNKIKKETQIPDDFAISEAVRKWAELKGYSNLDDHLDNFITSCQAKGYKYSDWDAAFRGAISKNWAKIYSFTADSMGGQKWD